MWNDFRHQSDPCLVFIDNIAQVQQVKRILAILRSYDVLEHIALGYFVLEEFDFVEVKTRHCCFSLLLQSLLYG